PVVNEITAPLRRRNRFHGHAEVVQTFQKTGWWISPKTGAQEINSVLASNGAAQVLLDCGRLAHVPEDSLHDVFTDLLIGNTARLALRHRRCGTLWPARGTAGQG